ncbi:uncharacterized protein LOC115880646 [Sitophilus oryzae]|uniref:Uncharacterized protein LOC115880646 n=1 Tax=Sitophilus oryzae TaxID=7048 RepID=A0A6J2XRX0_SITOR|nr:uncharacterized protein LOC115880646 [Sitophilus oryzae]
MVVLDDFKENFIMEVAVDDVESRLRDEERKKTGRYLAVGVVLFIVAIGLYHAISSRSTQVSALLGATMIMFLYLLWLIYASQRRKLAVKKTEETIERQVTDVLENLNNMKKIQNSCGSHENQVYASSEDELERVPLQKKEKLTNEEPGPDKRKTFEENVRDYSFHIPPPHTISTGPNIYIRTYSIG